jgi:aspartate-semialdehyde dehydrogenase
MTRASPFGESRLPVAVLGATGAVGQAFVRLLANHPWFELSEVAASERSAGRRYGDAVNWLGNEPLAARIAAMTVQPCDPGVVRSPIAFSALDASAAGDAEAAFARAGRIVLSNARNYRMEPDVPLVIAEVNPDHLAVLDAQRANRGWKRGGGIVTNGNCAAIVATMALAPLQQRFGIRRAFVATLQAVSGAGYPGVASLDILGNVIPFIKDEEPKVEAEICKFLGSRSDGRIESAAIVVSAHTNRVPVQHGHTAVMSVELERKADMAEVEQAIAAWRGAPEACGLPTSPDRPLVLTSAADRPQPRRDVDAGGGMTVTVGRVRSDTLFDVKLVALGHNIVRGAAGASVLNAELMAATGLVDGSSA